MGNQKAVAPHLRKKNDETKITNRPSPIVPVTNTAKPNAPNIHALKSIARAANVAKATVPVPGVDTAQPILPDEETVKANILGTHQDTDHYLARNAAIFADHHLNNDSSDIIASPTMQSIPANAVVLYGVQQTLSPMEMIQHETVRNLQSLLDDAQAQLNAANARCDQLSAENESLHRQISEATQDGEQPETSGILGETLVGYESSEEAEEDVVSSDPSTQAQLSANERLDTVTQILELQNATQADFKDTIAKQAEQIDALQRRIEEDKHSKSPKQKEAISAVDFRQLVARIANLEKGTSTSKSPSSQQLTMLQARMELKRRQHERIDNAVIREDLLSFYEIMSDQIAGFHDVEDGFKGTEDELWALRDRVLCRLAIFEKYGEAVEEAKAAMEYNGKGSDGKGSGKGSVGVGGAAGGSKSRW